MKWIVDTSVAMKWYFPEVHWKNSAELLRPPHELAAPSYLRIEFDNVLAKRIRMGDVKPNEATPIRAAFHRLAIKLHDVFELLDDAFTIAIQTRRSVYDCTFLALALRTNSLVITADRRFFDGVQESSYCTSVTWIEDLVA